MAEVVEPHPPELRLLQQLVEDPMAQIIAVERPAALGAEDPLGHASPAVLEVSFFRACSSAFSVAVSWADMSTRLVLPFFGVVTRPATRLRRTSMNRPLKSMSGHWRASSSPSRSPVRTAHRNSGYAAEASTAPAAAARATPPNTPTPPSETR